MRLGGAASEAPEQQDPWMTINGHDQEIDLIELLSS